VLCVALLELGDFLHDVLPCPSGSGGVACLPVHPRQMQAERGGFLVLVLGGDEAIGFVFVARLEGFLFLGNEVFAIESAPAAAEHAITIFHLMSHGYEHEPTRSAPVSELSASYFSFNRIVAEFAGH
jgi:hypothetical protein